ncbi:MAG: hypothetical protein KatS3mg105_0097 [Gemmatales bacterium]|nr:MAG: hypothetical protein KatS3mg105_0097 [Gemmatales bacterium]
MEFRSLFTTLVLFDIASVLAVANEPIQLRESFVVGHQYHVSCRVSIAGRLSVPDGKGEPNRKRLNVEGESAIEYDERILETKSGVSKSIRFYRKLDFKRVIDGQSQVSQLRPAVSRLVLLRLGPKEVPFSPDGPLTWNEIDLVRTDVFTPALAGLLPERPVRLHDRWTADTAAVLELTDLDRIEQGRIECRLEELNRLGGRSLARISFSGTVTGINEDGPNRQELDGYLYFDRDANMLTYLYLKGANCLLNDKQQELGRIEGRFTLTRRLQPRCAEISPRALASLELEPNTENTRLLYDNPALGVKLRYARNWRVSKVEGRQIALEDGAGNGLLLTLEPVGQVPGATEFLDEAHRFLTARKAQILSTEQRTQLQASPRVEHFAFKVRLDGATVVLDYYILHTTKGGATIAARLLPNAVDPCRREIRRIIDSLSLTRTMK